MPGIPPFHSREGLGEGSALPSFHHNACCKTGPLDAAVYPGSNLRVSQRNAAPPNRPMTSGVSQLIGPCASR